MKLPVIIYIVLTASSMLYIAYLHGKPKEGKNNIFISLFAQAIFIGLLYWGGFFTN